MRHSPAPVLVCCDVKPRPVVRSGDGATATRLRGRRPSVHLPSIRRTARLPSWHSAPLGTSSHTRGILMDRRERQGHAVAVPARPTGFGVLGFIHWIPISLTRDALEFLISQPRAQIATNRFARRGRSCRCWYIVTKTWPDLHLSRRRASRMHKRAPHGPGFPSRRHLHHGGAGIVDANRSDLTSAPDG